MPSAIKVAVVLPQSMHDDGKLDTIIDDGNLRDLTLQQRFTPSTTSVPEVTVSLPAAIAYDALLGAPQGWVQP